MWLWSLAAVVAAWGAARVSSEAYNAKVGVDRHVNIVSRNFLSFTVDPKYLFSSGQKRGSSKECICMAALLSPAYLRIAGPSTAHMTFHNSTISIDETISDDRFEDVLGKRRQSIHKELDADTSFEKDAKKFLEKVLGKHFKQTGNIESSSSVRDSKKVLESLLRRHKKRNVERVQVSSDEWKRFSSWAKAVGFEIVFALNNEEKTASGLWDPHTTLDILSVAEKEGVEDVYWQLGYECRNQSIDEYLTDLETLRVILDTAPGRQRGWRVAGADVTGCLRARSRSDFKDYVTLAMTAADALLLDGNSSSYELERLSPAERSKLLRLINASRTPLWMSERSAQAGELSELSGVARAAAWLASLGHAARRGAQVHFRELTDYELYQPTLSFYMALLFKSLVGERVLDVDMESAHTVLFAHCTSLRRQPVPGAVTLFGANMDDEPARISLKLSKREEGGDIMQFILSEDDDGIIIVNGREMSQPGDIRPVVRRVRPFKTLLINLPAKSIGFWVLANTKIEPCRNYEHNDKEQLAEAESVETEKVGDKKKNRTKRSVANKANTIKDVKNVTDILNNDKYSVDKTGNKEFDDTIERLNNYLREIHNILKQKTLTKVKRQIIDGQGTKKLRRQLLKIRNDLKIDDKNKPILSFIENLLQFARNGTRLSGNERYRNLKSYGNKIGKRHNAKEYGSTNNISKRSNAKKNYPTKHTGNYKRVSRIRRNIILDKIEEGDGNMEDLEEHNEINVSEEDTDKLKASNQEDLNDNNENETPDIEKLYKDILSSGKEIDNTSIKEKKVWELLHHIQKQLNKLSEDKIKDRHLEVENGKEADKITVKTEITDDGATIQFKEQPNGGWVKSTFESIFYILDDFNTNLNRFWGALPFL